MFYEKYFDNTNMEINLLIPSIKNSYNIRANRIPVFFLKKNICKFGTIMEGPVKKDLISTILLKSIQHLKLYIVLGKFSVLTIAWFSKMCILFPINTSLLQMFLV